MRLFNRTLSIFGLMVKKNFGILPNVYQLAYFNTKTQLTKYALFSLLFAVGLD